jgi:3-methyladenine DNA glycosylase AlkD
MAARYFRAIPGGYGEGNRFRGLTVPAVRRIARRYGTLPLRDLAAALDSAWHEERLFALFVLVARFERGTSVDRERIFRLYWRKRRRVDNWDLVDVSAPTIVGEHLADELPEAVRTLAASRRVWDRRIAMLATFPAIRRGEVAPALTVAEWLLDDPHDLVQKAVGWMLREVGRRDRAAEERFLKEHADRMPRTMLRYAIERFPAEKRHRFLAVPRTRTPRHR